MFNISTSTCYSKSTVKSFDTFADAEAYAKTEMEAACFDTDPDHEGCADFLAAGEIYSIEPDGFKVAA